MSPLEEQVAAELDQAAWPLVSLLGTDLADLARERVAVQARVLAAQLAQDSDDRLAAQTVIDLMAVLWPRCDPDPEWWRTPLGRAVARSAGREGSEAITYSVAAAMLGVHPGTVAQMAHRGNLEKHPEGGITRASVLARLARQA